MNNSTFKCALAAAVLSVSIGPGMSFADDQPAEHGQHFSTAAGNTTHGAVQRGGGTGHELGVNNTYPSFTTAEQVDKPTPGGEWFHSPAPVGDDNSEQYRWGIRILF